MEAINTATTTGPVARSSGDGVRAIARPPVEPAARCDGTLMTPGGLVDVGAPRSPGGSEVLDGLTDSVDSESVLDSVDVVGWSLATGAAPTAALRSSAPAPY